MLTGIEDADKQILLRLDIPSLIKYNQTYKHNLDKSFWKMKFEYDHLPFLATTNKTFDAWVKEYLKVENIVNTVDEIIKIHAIEAVRIYDQLNLIMLPLVSDNVVDFDDYEDFKADYDVVNILIELKDDRSYKIILEGIFFDTNQRITIEKEGDWRIVFDILVISMYIKYDIEILDIMSMSFIEDYNRNLNGFTQVEQRILNKRFGIRDSLYHSGLLWY